MAEWVIGFHAITVHRGTTDDQELGHMDVAMGQCELNLDRTETATSRFAPGHRVRDHNMSNV